MQELEKILEEMETSAVYAETKGGYGAKCVPIGVIERIIRNHMNDGWIPVSQNVPVNSNPVLIWSVNSEKKSEGFSIGSYDYGEWWIGMFEGILTFPTFLKPIAWRPLPEPYRLERSEE